MGTIKKYSFLLLLGAMAAATAGTAYASGAPLTFDNYVVGDVGGATTGNVAGEITANCTAGANFVGASVSCGEATISDGMLQRQVTVTNALDSTQNGTYIQFIMTESGAQGDASAAAYSTARGNLYFTNEDFVKMNNRGSGLASKQTILDANVDSTDSSIEERFSNIVSYNIGWARGDAFTNPWVSIDQILEQVQYLDALNNPVAADSGTATQAKELLNETTSIVSDGSQSGAAFPNTNVDIAQRLLLQDQNYTNQMADGMQKFKHKRISGQFTDASSDASGPYGINYNLNPVLDGGTNGGIVEWNAGNTLSATWVGFELVDPSVNFSSLFGFTSIENETPISLNNYSKLSSLTNPEAGGAAPYCPYSWTYLNGSGQCISDGSGPGLLDPGAGSVVGSPISGWDAIMDTNGNPLFGAVESIYTPAPAVAQLTDYSVKNLIIVAPPSDGLNYIASSTALPTANATAVEIAKTDYNQWTVTNGVFDVTGCPAVADPGGCAAQPVVNGDGMYQRVVMINGEAYYQTILVDGAVTGDPNAANFAANSIGFISETFVKTGGTGTGIAGQTHLAEQGDYNSSYTGGYLATNETNPLPSNGGDFVQDVALNTGWANMGTVFVSRDTNGDNIIDPGEGVYEPAAAIELTQDVFVPDRGYLDVSPMQEHFSMETGTNQADKRIMMTSQVGTSYGTLVTDFPDPINFKSVMVSGAYQQSDSSTYGDPFASNGVTWVAGDALQLTWVAGEYPVTPSPGTAKVNSTRIANRTAGTSYDVTDTASTPVDPAFWFVDPFLSAPNSYPAFP